MAQQQQPTVATGAVLREFLLAVERAKQPLDDAIESFALALASDATEQLAAKFLDIQPHADALLHAWPDTHGAGTRWAKRESIATFFRVLALLLRAQTKRNADAAEVLALRVVREKNAHLEKVLTWSDKPVIEFEALSLMTALVCVNGAVAREFVRLFNFQSAPFSKLAQRRLKKPEPVATAAPTTDSDDDQPLPVATKPAFQIREAYVQLVLALTACADKSVHRFAMKDNGLAASLFKSIDGDSVALLTHIVATLNALVLHSASVDAKTKLAIFNAHCVHQLLPLLQSDDVGIARVALDVLNALFFDAGALYAVPQQHALRLFLTKASVANTTNETDDASPASDVAYAVKVIRNAVVTIGVNEYMHSAFAQQLVASFMTTYPGLVAEYVHALALPLEPKTGFRWFGVASLVQTLLTCSLDAIVPGLPTTLSVADNASGPAWCSAAALATRLVLPLSCRKELSRGIQHTNRLVVYSTLGILDAALQRFAFVSAHAVGVSTSDLAAELRGLVPSPEALVSLLLKLCTAVDARNALVYVRALGVFRRYVTCLPHAMREVKLDVTKLLAWQLLDTVNSASSDIPPALTGVIVSEMLQFLFAVDASRLHVLLPPTNPSASPTRSKLLQLLQLYVATESPAIEQLCAHVLARTLLVSTVFGSDVDAAQAETTLWLDALRAGGDACAAFVESLVQHVLADPFAYLAAYRNSIQQQQQSHETNSDANAPLSLSPGAIALVTFFRSTDNNSAALASFRSVPSVVVFGTRVLLSLLSITDAPQQLVALITTPHTVSSSDDDVDESNAAVAAKRKRVDDASAAATRFDAYEQLALYCQSLVSPNTSALQEPTQPTKTKKRKAATATATTVDWRVATSRHAFTQQLVALAPSTFVASWEPIVDNCVALTSSLDLVIHFVGAWVGSSSSGSDLVGLFAKPTKPKTKQSTAASNQFVRELPLATLLQTVLLDTSAPSLAAIATVTAVLRERMRTDTLDVRDAARMCELLLFALRFSKRRSDDNAVDSALCRLLLLALTFVVVNATAGDDGHVARIVRKLHGAANSAASPVLAYKLSALEVVALHLLYSRTSRSGSVALLTESSESLDRLLQRAGVPSVVLLAPLVRVDVRVQLLQSLLQSRFSLASVDGVLLQHVLQSLATTTAQPLAAYSQRTLLARRLWQLLVRVSPSSDASAQHSVVPLYAAGFAVLGALGGVSASDAHAVIDTTLVPMLMHAARDATHSVSLTELLRCVVLAICHDGAIGPSTVTTLFTSDLETALATALTTASKRQNKGETSAAVEEALLVAAFDVFTRLEAPALRAFADARVPKCVEQLLMVGDADGHDHSQRLSFLRHALLASSDAPATGATTRVASAVTCTLVRLATQHPDGVVLSTTQQTALLLAMRATASESSSDATTQKHTVMFLVKCALQALQTLATSSSDDTDATPAVHVHALMNVVAAVADDITRCANPATLSAIVQALEPLLTRAQTLDLSRNGAFSAFVQLTNVFLQLTVAADATGQCEASTSSFDYAHHLTVLTDDPQFVPSLERNASESDERARLALVRAVYWLVQRSGVYDCALFKTLLSVYTMSLSPVDCALRVVFDAFDAGAGVSLAHFGFRFGASSTTIVTAADSVVASGKSARTDLVDDSKWLLSGGLEPQRVRATIEHFPLDRRVASTHDEALLAFNTVDNTVMTTMKPDAPLPYDPAFLLPMLAHFISSSDLPDAAVVTQGLLGVAVRATSSTAACVRAYAFGIVAHVHESLSAESIAFKAGRQIHLLLESLRLAVDAPLVRIASVVTVFINDALAVLTRPSHALYPLVNHFLLSRPALDVHDVPMFYSLFHSRAPLTFRHERSWFLHALRRGVCDDVDVQLLVRRHVLPILLSFFGSELADDHTMALVAQIVTQSLQTRAGATYLLTKAALIEWIGALLLQRADDAKTLLLLTDLFESALVASEELCSDLDTAQHRALALQVVNAFAALNASVDALRTRPMVRATLARCAALVLRVAHAMCSLATLTSVVTAIAQSAAASAATTAIVVSDDDVPTDANALCESDAAAVLRCMETIVSDRLLEHSDLHARAFSDWAAVLCTVADVVAALLATDDATAAAKVARPVSNVTLRVCAKQTLLQLKRVLDRVPMLKQQVLVRAARTRIAYAALL